MPARHAARTTSHSTFGDMASPQTRPALLIARNTGPSVIAAAAAKASTAAFTHDGIGTVRTWPALPTRSAMTQRSSRCWTASTYSVAAITELTAVKRAPIPTSASSIMDDRLEEDKGHDYFSGAGPSNAASGPRGDSATY